MKKIDKFLFGTNLRGILTLVIAFSLLVCLIFFMIVDLTKQSNYEMKEQPCIEFQYRSVENLPVRCLSFYLQPQLCLVAQLAEHLTVNQRVTGSNPVETANNP